VVGAGSGIALGPSITGQPPAQPIRSISIARRVLISSVAF